MDFSLLGPLRYLSNKTRLGSARPSLIDSYGSNFCDKVNEIVNDATSFRQIYEHVEAAALITNLSCGCLRPKGKFSVGKSFGAIFDRSKVENHKTVFVCLSQHH